MSTAPELPNSLEWINAAPTTLAAQRGRVVALAFFSAGSVYSQNLLEDLRHLQARHADGLIVIGIHTPKFDAERDAGLALKATNRLGLRHAVAHDPAFATWQHYGIRVWPTLILIDPMGNIARSFVGDLQREAIEMAINELLAQAGSEGRQFEPVPPEMRAEPRGALLFPLGLAVTASHVYVADSGHHRILECSHEGRVVRQFGTGNSGYVDGPAEEAHFAQPRGLWVAKDLLYVADTGNHALRRIKLLSGEVETLAGTGRPGPLQGKAASPSGQPLNAPWAVVASSDRLYLAMTGSHQVWEYNLGRSELRVLAGTGALDLVDGPANAATFAQPAGLALVQQTLYVADAAASAIRSINLGSGQVNTLVGQGLYSFGNQDGTRSAALLQYPVGLALDPRSPLLWIADCYNNSLRMLRLGGGDLKTHEIEYKLHEPTAVAATDGVVWLANSSAHEVLRIDLESATARRLPIGE